MLRARDNTSCLGHIERHQRQSTHG
jgi:hypothetical protein